MDCHGDRKIEPRRIRPVAVELARGEEGERRMEERFLETEEGEGSEDEEEEEEAVFDCFIRGLFISPLAANPVSILSGSFSRVKEEEEEEREEFEDGMERGVNIFQIYILYDTLFLSPFTYFLWSDSVTNAATEPTVPSPLLCLPLTCLLLFPIYFQFTIIIS